MKLIVGLGNPGPEYEATRHNVGFLTLDAYLTARKAKARKSNGGARWVQLSVGGEPLYFIKPMEFMNRSGRSVAWFAEKYSIAPEETLVLHDDADLVEERIQLKRGGGAGGHRGLESIFAEWGERDFYRLRIGIGKPADQDLSDYVLEYAPKSLLRSLVDRSVHALERVLEEGPTRAINTINAPLEAPE